MNPKQQKQAIEEYKKNTPPLIKLGQGRDEPSELDEYIEMLWVLTCAAGAIAALMFACYLAGGWQ